MLILFSRFLYFAYRISNSIRFLGFFNTLKIFFISKVSRKNKMSIFLFKNKFYFRPKIDSGSYERLTKSQYVIRGSFTKPIDTIIDAGANIGSQSIRLINLNQNLKKIICIEPDTESSELCTKNLKNYNAKVYNRALSNTSNITLKIQKTINSEMSETIEGSDSIIQSNNFHTIKTISINEIVKRESLTKIDLLKLDINGYEDELFDKNTEWLQITNCIGFNNGDINKVSSKIIKKYENSVGKIKVYNIDQMIFLIREDFDWLPKKGFMSSKNIGHIEIDQRF